MSAQNWTPTELNKLRRLYKDKPEWTTDYQYSALLAPQFERSPESLRWQMRQFHREVMSVEAPKILLLDIETLPIEALTFSTFKTNIYMDQIKKDWSILCWSAKWLFDSKVYGQVVTPQEAIEHKDGSVLTVIWEMVNEANWVVTHNGISFDMKRLNARWFVHDYPRPMYYQQVDTKKVANEHFDFTYSKLDWIAQIIGVGRKIETDFKWWLECERGDPTYLRKMLKYNKMDVHLEEEVYLKLRPWMDKHPNMNLYSNMIGNCCPTCGNNDLNWKGTYSTALGIYQAFRCEMCGAIGRSTKKAHKLHSSEVQN